MDVIEAIESRRSIRAFLDTPIPKDTITKILTTAQRAPSGTNTQPWHVYICAGQTRDNIVNDVQKMFDLGEFTDYDKYDYYPSEWKEVHRNRRRGIGWDLYGLLGIKKGDREKSHKQHRRNFCFFDAPVGLFFTTDSYLGKGSWSDVGLFMQTVMLAARKYNLHTCPQAAWINYQQPIFKHLNIPSDQVLVSGMAMGYENLDAIENTLQTKREKLLDMAHFYGF